MVCEVGRDKSGPHGGRDKSGPYLDATYFVGYTVLQMGHWKISRFLSIYL